MALSSPLWPVHTAREQYRDGYRELEERNRKQLALVPGPLSDQCEEFCTISLDPLFLVLFQVLTLIPFSSSVNKPSNDFFFTTGILLWELYSCGKIPYQNTATDDVWGFVVSYDFTAVFSIQSQMWWSTLKNKIVSRSLRIAWFFQMLESLHLILCTDFIQSLLYNERIYPGFLWSRLLQKKYHRDYQRCWT